jgi:hypothetical protein
VSSVALQIARDAWSESDQPLRFSVAAACLTGDGYIRCADPGALMPGDIRGHRRGVDELRPSPAQAPA